MPSRLQKARVLVISPDHLTGVRVQEALGGACVSTVRVDVTELARGFAFDLVVLAAHFAAIDEVAKLNVPAILLASAATLPKAQGLVAGKRAAVVQVPFANEALLSCVQQFVGTYVEPW